MKPKSIQESAGAFQTRTAPRLQIGAEAEQSESAFAAVLRDLLRERFPGQAIHESRPERHAGAPILLAGLTSDDARLGRLVEEARQGGADPRFAAEGFALEVSTDRILLAAKNRPGLLYGALKLQEMAGPPGEGLNLPGVRLVDWPQMRRRGLHTLVRGQADLPALERLIRRHLPERRLNELILEINYGFQFKSHPEMSDENGLSLQDCRRLSDLAKRHHVRLIPMINCLGHQSWAETTFRLLTAHPEFDETPDFPKDNKGIYCRSWCPSHPEVHRFVADLCVELIDAFGADAFHLGMDEVFILGKCPRCQGKANADLFAASVNALHREIGARRKVELQIWGDRLLDAKTTGYGEWEASANDTAGAIDRIPKDLVICDWHYGVREEYPSLPVLVSRGFRVWPAGWNSKENARKLAGAALRLGDEKIIGYLATTWIGESATERALSGDAETLKSVKNAQGVAEAVNEGARLAWEGLSSQE